MQNSDQDYHNFSTPSSHRLPTVSGTQAIRDAVQHSRPISSGLASLDAILSSTRPSQNSPGGFPRGVVTELFGPPGVGKTSLALQASVNAICCQKSKVTWIDTSSSLVLPRLQQLVDGLGPTGTDPDQPSQQQENLHETLLEDFCHWEATSLPKLLALLLYPIAEFPPAGTVLVVLDDLSSLILSTLPRVTRQSTSTTTQQTPTQIRNDFASKQAISRRAQVISSLASALQTFAAAKNVAVLVTCKASINLKVGRQAFLRPALTSQHWDSCLGARVALYRDFWPGDNSDSVGMDAKVRQPTDFERMSLRYAQVVSFTGREALTNEVGFVIESNGIREVTGLSPSTQRSLPLAEIQPVFGSDDVGAEDDVTFDDAVEPKQDAPSTDHEGEISNGTEMHVAKRKIAQIADSEDEDGMHTATSAVDVLASDPSDNPLPQISQSEIVPSQNHYIPTFQTAKKLRFDENNFQASNMAEQGFKTTKSQSCEPDEMLLDQIDAEASAPAFSQAAAEMSDPLTPSDDAGQSP